MKDKINKLLFYDWTSFEESRINIHGGNGYWKYNKQKIINIIIFIAIFINFLLIIIK